MAQFFPGKTECALCNAVIGPEDEPTLLPAFLARNHRLWQFSDASFHRRCYEAWSEREYIEDLLAGLMKLNALRPAPPAGMESFGSWCANSHEVRNWEGKVDAYMAADLAMNTREQAQDGTYVD